MNQTERGYLLLTGATGLLGQYLLRDLLRAGVRVAALVRSTRHATARQRVELALRHFEQQAGRLLPRPVVLEGDLTQPGLGLAPAHADWIAEHCTAVLHSAASITFYADSATGEPYRTNVDGTRHLLELCPQTRLESFHHVSTAYVCGRRAGRIGESELDAGQTFGNDYERSKLEAERLVRQAAFPTPATIYRPAILVGDSHSGYTSTFHGFYAPLKILWQLAQHDPSWASPTVPFIEQLGLRGDECKNVVPVDWASAVIAHILRRPEHHGRTYHLAPSQPVPVRDIEQAIAQAVSSRAPAQPAASPQLSVPPRDALHEALDVYRAYFRDDPRFDTSNARDAAPHLPCPDFDATKLTRLAQYAIDTNFGWPRPLPSPMPLDLDQALRPLLDRAGSARTGTRKHVLALELAGPAGGAWGIPFDTGSLAGAERGIRGDETFSVYTTVESLSALVQRRTTVDALLHAGRLVIFSNGDNPAEAVPLLAALVDFLRNQVSFPSHASREAVAQHENGSHQVLL